VRELSGSAAVLVATSDLDEALEVGDRIVVLNHGELVADLPPLGRLPSPCIEG